MIAFEDVSKVFLGPSGEEVRAVSNLSFEIPSGESLALLGTSGCGKTTTLKMINRLVEPSSGEIRVRGTRIQDQDPIRLRRSLGYVIQTGGLFPHLSARDNVSLLARLEGWAEEKIEARLRELFEMVRLPFDTFADRLPRELSGGQRQRIGIARALMLDPPVLLLDEPFGALDPITRRELHEEFLGWKESLHKTFVLVSHDLEEAFRLADRVALMARGELQQIGTEADFLERPANDFVRSFFEGHFGEGEVAA